MPGDGVTVPPHLARVLARLAVLGLAETARRDGGVPSAPGLARLLADLDGFPAATPVAIVDVRVPFTVSQASEACGVTRQWVRRLAGQGRLRGRRAGAMWLLDADGVEDYARRRNAA
jgi:excisionase family DNA binding protein